MKLLTVRGVPILLDASWLLLLPLLLWSLAEVAMPTLVPELSRVAYWAMALTATAGLAASLLLREGAHLLTAERVGIPLHAVNLLVLGGVADAPPDAPTRLEAELTAAATGFLASLALGSLFLAAFVGMPGPGTPLTVLGVLFLLAGLNGLMGMANLVPAYPLSGGRLLRAVFLRWAGDAVAATRGAVLVGVGLGLAVAAAGAWLLLSGSVLAGLWLVLLGLLVCRAGLARWPVRLARVRSAAS